jgi:DNA polymerase-3 subunit gamma/tau
VEIDAASNRGIDEIRELRENVRFAPSSSTYKVYIIDEVHMLTKEAFNALLKTLEEPPVHAVFILATTEVHRVPDTVVSRCQRFDFGRVEVAAIREVLEMIAAEEKVEADVAVLDLIAERSDGGFRDAITLFEQLISGPGGRISVESVGGLLSLSAVVAAVEIYRALNSQDVRSALQNVSSFIEDGGDPTQLLRELMKLGRYLLLAKTLEPEALRRELGTERFALVDELASSFDIGFLFEVLQEWQRAIESRSNLVPGLGIELALLRLIPADREVAEAASKTPESMPVEPEKAKETLIDSKAKEEKAPESLPKTGRGPKQQKAGGASEKLIRDRWPEIIEGVKVYNHSIAACLQVAGVESVEGDQINLAFPYKFHRERIDELKNKRVVEKVLAEVLQGDYRLNPVLREQKGVRQEDDDLVKAALDILGGEVVA